MTNLSDYSSYYRLPLRDPEDGMLVDFRFPKGNSGEYYVKDEKDFRVLKRGIRLNEGFLPNTLLLDGNGFAARQGSYGTWFGARTWQNDGYFPPITGKGRMFRFWGRTEGPMTANTGIRLITNYESSTDYSLEYLRWLSTYPQIYSASWISSSWTQRMSPINLSLTNDPFTFDWTLAIWGNGDRRMNSCMAFETDTVSDGDAVAGDHLWTGWPSPSEGSWVLQNELDAADEWYIRGFQIWDIE